MRVLILTKLYPNREKPLAAAFNRQQFGALAELTPVEIVVPLPWFPGARLAKKYTEAGQVTAVPKTDVLDGLTVHYPRALHLPKVGRPLAGALTTASLLPLARKLVGRFDIVLGSWAYPHGMATVTLAKLLGLPCAIKVHGSDINVLADMPAIRRQMAAYLPRANRVIAVSRALGDKVHQLGVPRERIDIVYNGVNQELFYPRDRAAMRRELGVPADEKVVLFVGWLLETKGVMELADAYKAMDGVRLYMIGDGPARPALEKALARQAGATLLGAKPLPEVAEWVGACDVLTLPSWAEGTPNVVLEALAAGRKVVATDVGGIPDLIQGPETGELVPAKNALALADALARVAATDYNPDEVVKAGSRGSWQDSARALLDALSRAAGTS